MTTFAIVRTELITAASTVITAAVDRFDRSRDRSIQAIRYDFRFFGNARELEICLVSKFQLCTTLGGRKNAEKPKRKNLDFLASSIDRFDNPSDP